jgi:hypothetical protein
MADQDYTEAGDCCCLIEELAVFIVLCDLLGRGAGGGSINVGHQKHQLEVLTIIRSSRPI